MYLVLEELSIDWEIKNIVLDSRWEHEGPVKVDHILDIQNTLGLSDDRVEGDWDFIVDLVLDVVFDLAEHDGFEEGLECLGGFGNRVSMNFNINLILWQIKHNFSYFEAWDDGAILESLTGETNGNMHLAIEDGHVG